MNDSSSLKATVCRAQTIVRKQPLRCQSVRLFLYVLLTLGKLHSAFVSLGQISSVAFFMPAPTNAFASLRKPSLLPFNRRTGKPVQGPAFIKSHGYHDMPSRSGMKVLNKNIEPTELPYLSKKMQQASLDSSSKNEKLRKHQEIESKKLDVQLLLLDNYDSYTYNIYSYLSTICKKPPVVVSNDAYESWDELVKSFERDNICIDGIVISPGPGRPEVKKDLGICLEAIKKNPNLPILGVCLGHQALGYYYNAKVKLSPYGPVHGLTSPVSYKVQDWENKNDTAYNAHDENLDCNLFENIPQAFEVVRYHSLIVEFPAGQDEIEKLPIKPIAWCKSDTAAENGEGEVCMALQHRVNPHYGVQFHPESVGTGEYGYRIFQNFCNFSFKKKCINDGFKSGSEIYVDGSDELIAEHEDERNIIEQDMSKLPTKGNAKYNVLVHKVKGGRSNSDTSMPSPESVFDNLLAGMDDSFWLDSSTGRKDADLHERLTNDNKDGCPIVSNSRFSIMGGDNGPLCRKIEYWGKDHKVEKRGLIVTYPGGRDEILDQDIITYMQETIPECGITNSAIEIDFEDQSSDNTNRFTATPMESIPFQYRGGFVGYLGYEVRHDTRNSMCNHEICPTSDENSLAGGEQLGVNPQVPTAGFLFADRSLVYDHWRDEWYLIAVEEYSEVINGESSQSIQWMKNTAKNLTAMVPIPPSESRRVADTESKLSFAMRRSKEEYAADIARCHKEIKNGESYELCLTNQLSTLVEFPNESSSSPLQLYKILRKNNPAPFAAFLSFNNSRTRRRNVDNTPCLSSFSICCSSPERFLSVNHDVEDLAENGEDHGWEFAPPFSSYDISDSPKYIVETKPIKGTVSRIIANKGDPNFKEKIEEDQRVARKLQKSEKNRAENLMIVDLLRNDLSRVCEPGSVHVPKLMGIESFATVHQMVSTIRGLVDPKYTPIDIITASFPGGSMTGAPKLRSVDILDDLELGNSRGPYSGCLGYFSLNGAMDMNIVIRTAIVAPERNSQSDNNWEVSIGAGGAITALSDSDDEFDEMLLKASAILKSVQEWHDNVGSK